MILPWLETQSTLDSARQLLGMKLSLGACSGLIVETEAYLGARDQAAHAFNHRHTTRNHSLFLAAGTVYVYRMRQYCLLNIVTQPVDVPEQIGIGLTNGPGKLCQALAIDKQLDGTVLNQSGLSLAPTDHRPRNIAVGPRIGIPNKEPWTSAPLRFYVAGNPFVSKIPRRDQDLEMRGWQS